MRTLDLRHAPLRIVVVASCLLAAPLAAQTPAADPSARLRAVLPVDVAERVLGRIAEARARELPAQALEHRALELAAKGVAPADIETGIGRHAERLERARAALVQGGRELPTDAETEAAELVLHQGAGGEAVSALAEAAPSGHSLAVPLFVLSQLMDRGLPSDQALRRVHAALEERLAAPAADRRPSHAPGRPESLPSGRGRERRPRPPSS